MKNPESQNNIQKINDSVFLDELLQGKTILNESSKREDILTYLKVLRINEFYYFIL